MKKSFYTILLAIHILSLQNAIGQWVKLTKPSNTNYTTIGFTDELNGWIGSNEDNTLHKFTNDGGKTWYDVNMDETYRLPNLVYFANKNLGFLGSKYEGSISETWDGGKTWRLFGTAKNNPQRIAFTSIKKIDDYYMATSYSQKQFEAWKTVIYVIDSNFNIKKTIQLKYDAGDIFFLDSLIGYANNPEIKKTIDGGKSWNAMGMELNTYIRSFHFTDVDHGVGVGPDATIIHTHDGGLSWKIISSKAAGLAYNKVKFVTPTRGYICGQQGTILKTVDGGLNWKPMKSGTFEYLSDISFVDSTLGFCIGNNGTVLKLIEDLTVPQVTKINVPSGKLCAGGNYAIGYLTNKKFSKTNAFTAYLSDGQGDFTNAVAVGKVANDTSGTINITIPANTPRNLGYRIRIESDSPIGTSAANDGFIEIQPSQILGLNVTLDKYEICEGDKVTLSSFVVAGGSKPQVSWYNNKILVGTGLKFTFAPKDKDKIFASAKSSLACTTPDSVVFAYPVQCTKEPLPEVVIPEALYVRIKTPSTPLITIQGNTLSSSISNGNQWYKDAEAIPSATAQTFIATERGMYKVAVNDGVCPPQFSETVNVLVTGNEKASELSTALIIYPNPANGILQINTSLQIAKLVVYQSNGTKVMEIKATENLDVSALPEGLYLLEAWDIEGRRVLKKFEKR